MLLEVKEINSYYGDSHVLQDVTFNVAEKEMVSILGRNGVGKSTLLKSIMGIVMPRQGSILFKKEELIGKPPFKIARKGMGYVPEDRRVFPGLTVRENLLMGITNRQVKNYLAPWTIDRVYNVFPRLSERDKTQASSLSGGEQQVLTLMRTLLGNPEIILIDEPSEGLSPMMIKVIFEMIRDLHTEGMSIVLVDQNLFFACRAANKVHIMSKGRIVFSGTGREVQESEDVQKKYLAL